LTTLLVRICFPYIFFVSSMALAMGILNSLGHFLSPALAPSVLNVVLITTALWSYFTHGNVAVGQAVGVLIAGFGQWLLQQPFLTARGFSWRGPWSWKDPGVRRMGRLMGPSVFGSAVYQLNILLGTLLASLLPTGSVSYLYYADRLVQLPLGVFGVAVGMAALPGLANLAAMGKMDEFKTSLNSALGLSLFVGLPATAGLIALSGPIIATLFTRGAFTPEAAQATSLALMAYAVGLPAFACVRPLVSAFYSLEDTRTPVLAACLSMVLNASLGYALMGPLHHVGLALAASVASWVNVLFLGWALGRKLGGWWCSTARMAAMAGLSLGVGLAAWAALPLGRPSLAAIPLLAGLYIFVATRVGLDEAVLFRDIIRARLARKRPAGNGK
jgi:putative peptidoglycan lipid II flippase